MNAAKFQTKMAKALRKAYLEANGAPSELIHHAETRWSRDDEETWGYVAQEIMRFVINEVNRKT